MLFADEKFECEKNRHKKRPCEGPLVLSPVLDQEQGEDEGKE